MLLTLPHKPEFLLHLFKASTFISTREEGVSLVQLIEFSRSVHNASFVPDASQIAPIGQWILLAHTLRSGLSRRSLANVLQSVLAFSLPRRIQSVMTLIQRMSAKRITRHNFGRLGPTTFSLIFGRRSSELAFLPCVNRVTANIVFSIPQCIHAQLLL